MKQAIAGGRSLMQPAIGGKRYVNYVVRGRGVCRECLQVAKFELGSLSGDLGRQLSIYTVIAKQP
jgi:hypothetical protein